MSEDVRYRGKLTKLSNKENLSLEERYKHILEENIPNFKLREFDDSYEERFRDEFYEEYYINQDTIYKVQKEYVYNSDDCTATKDINGDIMFDVSYYNGGCSFDEALDDAISNIKTDRDFNYKKYAIEFCRELQTIEKSDIGISIDMVELIKNFKTELGYSVPESLEEGTGCKISRE